MSDKNKKKAILVVEDGTVAEGISAGAEGTTYGELVFNTGMSGYQEIYTDPSYAGQIVMLTYPLIGNYGGTDIDMESHRPHARGVVMRELCEKPNSWRVKYTLKDFLLRYGIVGIEGVDTRKLTRHIRSFGAMRSGISTELSSKELLEKVKESPTISGQDFVSQVQPEKAYKYEFTPDPMEDHRDFPARKWDHHIVIVDCGVKINIAKCLVRRGCKVTIVPGSESSDSIMKMEPDGIMVGNGPGDPKDAMYVVENVKPLIGKVPVFGLCLGHQLISLALGADTYKLKFGHRGSNQPVKDIAKNHVVVTSQNHGYAVREEGLGDLGLRISHFNVNDGTVEGVAHESYPLISVQFHPEASPGPMDSRYLFDEFLDMVGQWKAGTWTGSN